MVERIGILQDLICLLLHRMGSYCTAKHYDLDRWSYCCCWQELGSHFCGRDCHCPVAFGLGCVAECALMTMKEKLVDDLEMYSIAAFDTCRHCLCYLPKLDLVVLGEPKISYWSYSTVVSGIVGRLSWTTLRFDCLQLVWWCWWNLHLQFLPFDCLPVA